MKKRCSRCHARLDGNRKTCPYCGTMVRKRRGNVKVAASVGTGGMSGVKGVLDNVTLPALSGKHLLIIAAVIIALIIAAAAIGCDSCGSCAEACSTCSSCGSCSACSSCGEGSKGQGLANSTNYKCEYYKDNVLYYVDGDRIMALEDGMATAQPVLAGSGIGCIYVDDDRIYYIISGKVYSSPVGLKAVSGSDIPSGSVLLDPAALGYEKINGFSLIGKKDLCFWAQKADGERVICITDRSGSGEVRTIYTGKYFNVQCYADAVYFASGEENTYCYIMRIDPETGDSGIVFAQAADHFVLSGGRLIVCVMNLLEDGTPSGTSELIYLDAENGKQLHSFESFPGISGLAANDQWVYYKVDDTDAGQTLVYRFSGDGENHQLVFRKLGSYRLYGIAGSYFSLFGDNVYYICNYDQAPGSIVLTEHTVLG